MGLPVLGAHACSCLLRPIQPLNSHTNRVPRRHCCPCAGKFAATGFTADLLADTRRAFQAKLGAVFASAASGLSQASAAVVAAAALYEELLPSLAVDSQHMQALVGASGGVPAADRLLSNALQSTPPEVRGVKSLEGVL